jgi:uncharacterized protein with ATP-grasp and redox domains
MKLNAHCMHCMMESNWNRIKHHPENVRDEYMRAFVKILADAKETDSAPAIISRIQVLRRDLLGVTDDYEAVKRYFNALMLEEAPALRARIDASPDPLNEAMRIAMAANYIDFGAVEDVNAEKLRELLADADRCGLPPEETNAFRRELGDARRLTLLTDNCGEIVLDRLHVETILRRHPGLSVTAVVRGAPVSNDATEADVRAVGLDRVARIVSNGTDIGGTQLDAISEEARSAIEEADLILSKGQGNFETLSGCGLNVYYLFLCKCDLFTLRVGMQRFQGVFANDRRLENRLKA